MPLPPNPMDMAKSAKLKLSQPQKSNRIQDPRGIDTSLLRGRAPGITSMGATKANTFISFGIAMSVRGELPLKFGYTSSNLD